MLGFVVLMRPHFPQCTLSERRFLVVSLAFALSILMGRAQEIPSTDSAEVHVGKGYEAVKDERYQVAAEEFQAALALNPKLAAARYQLAACLFALGRSQEARQEFELVQKQTGGDSSVAYQLARIDLQAGDFDTAIKRLSPLIKNPPFPDTAYYLGTAYLEKGELTEAENWLQAAAHANPRDFRVPERLAHAYERAGQKEEAAKQFALASELRGRYDQAAQEAVACTRSLETQPLVEAKPVCDQLFDSHDPDRLTLLGMIYGQHGHYEEAVKPLEAASRLDPESFEINHNLGLSYFQLRRYGEARGPLEKAVALCPDFYGSNSLLGATLYTLGEDQAAYKVLVHAHALNPENGDTRTLLFKEALILASKEARQKNYPSALNYLRAAAELQPQDQEVQRRMSELLPLAGQPQAPNQAEKNTHP